MRSRANAIVRALCGLADDPELEPMDVAEEPDEFQTLLEKYWNLLQKGGAAILLLLILTGVSRADSLTETQVAQQLEQGVIPLASGVGDVLANNLLAAQLANISYTANEPESLQLSIDAVLKAISIYVWPEGPTLITDAQSEPVVWWQSETAIDTRASLSLSPTSIDFGDTPISTPEPSTLLLLVPLFGLIFVRSRGTSPQDVEVAIKALEIDDPYEKDAIRAFYNRERVQDRVANIKLLKVVLRVAAQILVLFLLSYALWSLDRKVDE